MAAPYPGKASCFYYPTPGGTPVAVTGAAMTQVGSTLTYYITTRTNAWWDPNSAVVVYDGVAPIANCTIIHAGGYVVLPAAPSGAVTVDVYTLPVEKIGGGFGWSVSKKGAALEATEFESIAGTLADKRYIGSGICEWTGSVKRHFWYARASYEDPIATAEASLIWTWIGSGSYGNDEAIVYTAGAGLAVARDSNVTTVTYVNGVTTSADIKAEVEADATLSALWELSYPATDGVAGFHQGAANPSIDISGGTDTSFNIIADGQTYPQLVTLTVAGLNSGAAIAAAMQVAIRAKGGTYAAITVTYEGAPDTDYYLITSGTKGIGSSITVTDATTANVADNLKIAVANGGASTAGTNGTGLVGAVSHVHASGGRDSLQQLSSVATKVLAIFYLESAAATSLRLEGVGVLTNLSVDEALESIVDSPLEFQGTGPLEVHSV